MIKDLENSDEEKDEEEEETNGDHKLLSV